MSAHTFTVTAPASSANLGPGFDCLALAVGIRNEVTITPGSGSVTVQGEGAEYLPTDHSNVIAHSFARVAPGELAHVDLHCENRIPPARGLGSSTAAAACGIVAGWEWRGINWSAEMLYRELAAIDGHGDNAAACAYGGLVLAPPSGGTAMHLADPEALSWLDVLFVIPDRHVPTAEARAALPATLDFGAATAGVGAAATLVAALLQHDEDALRIALAGDRLHEGARGDLIPELARVREAIATSPAFGATISGAGPTIAVWCPSGTTADVAATLDAALPGQHLVAPGLARAGTRREVVAR